MFVIGGIQKTSLLDFPKKIAAIVFTQGCNFRCGYCHNPELLNCIKNTDYTTGKIIDFLKTRKGKLDGVVITGGEPTLQNGLYEFIKEIKALDFAVKLDTNGTNPEILQKLINENMLDYVAMDIKAPLKKYPNITGVNTNTKGIRKNISLLINSTIDYEFRTTVLKSQLSTEDLLNIGIMLNGAKKYYLQKFVSSKIYDSKLKNAKTYSDEELEVICNTLKKYILEVEYR